MDEGLTESSSSVLEYFLHPTRKTHLKKRNVFNCKNVNFVTRSRCNVMVIEEEEENRSNCED